MTDLEQKIKARAYEIYEYRRDTGDNLILDEKTGELRELTAEDDYYEAEREIKYGQNTTS